MEKTAIIEIQFLWNSEETLVKYSARITIPEATMAAINASVRGVGFFTVQI